MWKLIRVELTYHRKLILWSYGLAALLVKLLIQAPPDQGDVAVEPVVLFLGLFVPYMVVVSFLTMSDRHENRLLLHGMLPTRLEELALARVLAVAVVSLLGVVVGLIFYAILPLLSREVPSIPAFLMANGLTILFGQGLLLSEEGMMRRGKKQMLWHLWPAVLLVAILLPPQGEDEPLPVAWNRAVHSDLKIAMVYLLIPAIATLNVLLFARRRDLTC